GEDQHDAEEDAEDRTAPAAQRESADDAGGNGLELEARTLPRLHRADAGGGEDAGKGGHEAGNGEGDHLDAPSVDADSRRGRAVAAGGEDVVAQAMPVQQQVEGQAKQDEPDKGGVDAQDRAAEHGVEYRIG